MLDDYLLDFLGLVWAQARLLLQQHCDFAHDVFILCEIRFNVKEIDSGLWPKTPQRVASIAARLDIEFPYCLR
jgi:hypothetical protein